MLVLYALKHTFCDLKCQIFTFRHVFLLRVLPPPFTLYSIFRHKIQPFLFQHWSRSFQTSIYYKYNGLSNMYISFKVFKTTNYANLECYSWRLSQMTEIWVLEYYLAEIVISDYRPILAIWTKLCPIYKEYVMGIVL